MVHARLALGFVGATVLVVDPFDDDRDSYWRDLKRLWVAIPR